MAQVRPIFNNFTAGEWSPRLESRIDLAKYAHACKTLENFLIMPHGGGYGRPGFHYVAGVKDHTRKVRLIPFEFNVEQAYALEFGHQYMRVFKNHGQVLTDCDSSRKLLLHFNGPDASTTFEDSGATGHTVTAHGTAQLDTDQKFFGSSSGLFNGSDAYLTILDHADFNLSGGIWTIDCRVRPLSLSGSKVIYYQETDANNSIKLYLLQGKPCLQILENGNAVVLLISSWTISSYSWTHIAAVENGDNYYLFVQGALADTATTTAKPTNYTGANIYIGSNATPGNYYNGHMDEFCLSKAKAWWTSAFSPPTQEYPLAGEASAVEITENYPYNEEDLATIKKTQSADVMYTTHRKYAPRKLSRSSHTSWNMSAINFIDGPYRDEETTPTITPGGTTGNITLTASAPLFYTHVGALWRIKHTSAWGYVKITAVTDSTHANATVLSALDGSGTPAAAWCEGAWSDYRGWPTAVMFHENRLWFARDLIYWGSRKGTDLWEDFTPGIYDDDPVIFTAHSDRVNLIRWLTSSSALIIGSSGEELRAKGTDGFITATNIDSKSATTHGGADIEPIKIGSVVLFLQRAGRKLRELIYNYEIEGYLAPDLTLLAEHITKPKIISLAFQQEPDPTIWAVRSDGVLLSMAYMRPEDVIGWARHITDGEVESIAVIPAPDESYNELWIAVKRTINGATKRYIEYLDPNLHVDSGLTYSGAPVLSVSGLSHLEGKTVKVVGDGMVYNDAVVPSGGTITLSPAFAAGKIQVGLGYTSKLETMRPEVFLGNGTSRGMKKAWGDCFVTLLECGEGLKINGETVIFRTNLVPFGQAVPLVTGDKRVNQLGWDRNQGRIIIEQTQPLPCTVLAIFGDLEIGG